MPVASAEFYADMEKLLSKPKLIQISAVSYVERLNISISLKIKKEIAGNAHKLQQEMQ